MAKNSIEAYGAEGKSNVLFFDPDKLPPATQREKVTELKAVGAKTTGHARAKAQREVIAPNAPPKMRSRVEVQARHDEAEVGSAERQLLAWVLGTV
jgi:hypothetical protein